MLAGVLQISGFIGGIITIVAGIVVLIWPKIIAYIVGIYLIIIGVLAVTAALR